MENSTAKKRKLLRNILLTLLTITTISIVTVFTICNYLVHRVDDNVRFNTTPAEWQVKTGAKEFILHGRITLSEDVINTYLSEISDNFEPLSDGTVIEAICVDITNKQNVYIRYNKNANRKIMCAQTDIIFNSKKQALEIDIDSVRIGKLKIPDFIRDWYMNKYLPYGDVYVSSGKIVVPLSAVEALNGLSFPIEIENLAFSEASACIQVKKPFEEETKLIENIFGDKAEQILSNIVDEYIDTTEDMSFSNIMSGCLSDFSRALTRETE
ncbi:MAG: hypothetical protein J6J30_02915 [Clostridia bacterium]|nr:hypothetical protein [Clostridia bacterium]